LNLILIQVQGSISLSISDPQFQTVAIRVRNNVQQMPGYKGAQIQVKANTLLFCIGHFRNVLQVHPNLDKQIWQSASILRLKSEQKPYPVGVDVGVLKWKVKLPTEDSLPITREFILILYGFWLLSQFAFIVSQLLAKRVAGRLRGQH
jgi:hypothetical protein